MVQSVANCGGGMQSTKSIVYLECKMGDWDGPALGWEYHKRHYLRHHLAVLCCCEPACEVSSRRLKFGL